MKPAPMEDIPALELSRATIRSRRGVARSVTPNRSRVVSSTCCAGAALASKEQLIDLRGSARAGSPAEGERHRRPRAASSASRLPSRGRPATAHGISRPRAVTTSTSAARKSGIAQRRRVSVPPAGVTSGAVASEPTGPWDRRHGGVARRLARAASPACLSQRRLVGSGPRSTGASRRTQAGPSGPLRLASHRTSTPTESWR